MSTFKLPSISLPKKMDIFFLSTEKEDTISRVDSPVNRASPLVSREKISYSELPFKGQFASYNESVEYLELQIRHQIKFNPLNLYESISHDSDAQMIIECAYPLRKLANAKGLSYEDLNAWELMMATHKQRPVEVGNDPARAREYMSKIIVKSVKKQIDFSGIFRALADVGTQGDHPFILIHLPIINNVATVTMILILLAVSRCKLIHTFAYDKLYLCCDHFRLTPLIIESYTLPGTILYEFLANVSAGKYNTTIFPDEFMRETSISDILLKLLDINHQLYDWRYDGFYKMCRIYKYLKESPSALNFPSHGPKYVRDNYEDKSKNWKVANKFTCR